MKTFQVVASLAILAIPVTLAAPAAASPCVNGVRTYHIGFDNLAVGSTPPVGLAGLGYNNFVVNNASNFCATAYTTNCQAPKPQHGSNYIQATNINLGHFNAANANPNDGVNAFNIDSFYFACVGGTSGGIAPAGCTLEVTSIPGTYIEGISSQSYTYTPSNNKMQQANFTGNPGYATYLSVIEGGGFTGLFIDSLVISEGC